MIDLTTYNSYSSFLKTLPNAKKLGYFVDDIEFRYPEDINTLKKLGLVYIDKVDRYIGYHSNSHHWTTTFVWKNIIPMLTKDLNIPFDETEFDYCPLKSGCHDIGFHYPKDDIIIRIGRYYDSMTIGYYSRLVRCFNNKGEKIKDCWTDYHGLFEYYHSCCIIRNESPKTDRVLLLNTDSMSIPIVPILIPYFNTIYVLDNRIESRWVGSNVDKSAVTDYMSLGLTRSYSYSDTFIYKETSNNKIFKQNIN